MSQLNNNQRDSKWANIRVGSGDQTIGQVGCTISVIGDILGLTPPQVNDALNKVNGFANGNLVIWASLEQAFPGITVRRVWSYDNADVAANVPNVIVEVPATPIGGRGSHWVNYIGNQQLKDPWTGSVRPTSDFPDPTGYCVITGTPTIVTNTIDTVAVLKADFESLVKKSSNLDTVADHFGVDKNSADSGKMIVGKFDKVTQDLTDCRTSINQAPSTNAADSTTPTTNNSGNNSPTGSAGSNPTVQPPVINPPVVTNNPSGSSVPQPSQKDNPISQFFASLFGVLVKFLKSLKKA